MLSGSSTWIHEIHIEESDAAPGSWLHPGPDLGDLDILKVNQWKGTSPHYFPCLSN